MRLIVSILWLAASFRAHAGTDTGYVVSVESGSVYLDLGANSGARAGEMFQIYTEGPELIHPVTGRPLGRAKTIIAQGTLRDVEPLYSEGTILSLPGTVAKGMRAELKPSLLAAGAAPSEPLEIPSRKPRWKSPWFKFPITAFTIGNFSNHAGREIAIASGKSVFLYQYPPEHDTVLAQFDLNGAADRLVSLESEPNQAAGPDDLFATFYNGAFNRMETDVLRFKSGLLQTTANLPWMIRSHEGPLGQKIIAAQQLVTDRTFPFSAAYPLVFSDGAWGPGNATMRMPGSDWIYDFTTARLDSRTAGLSLNAAHRLLVRFSRSHWESGDSFGQTPVRLRWQGNLLEFNPQIPIIYSSSATSVFLVRNEARFGILAQAFGIFDKAQISKKTWRDQEFETDWTARVPGYVTNMGLEGSPRNPTGLIAAVSTKSGRSSIWIYDP
ncbi:MAG: hypothetical protein ACYCPQ_10000 [Elusimicrobiota bacterium]